MIFINNSNKLAISIIAISSLLYGCSSTMKVTPQQTLNEANKLAEAGLYADAYAKYSSAIAQTAQWDSISSRLATISANAVKQDSSACVWGSKFSSKGDTQKLKALNESLTRLGREEERAYLVMSDTTSFFNILGEQPVLEIKAKRLAEDKDSELVTVYDKLTNVNVQAEVFDSYFKMAQKTLSEKKLEKESKAILKVVPSNKTALYYLGSQKYNAAESAYTRLMNDYNKNKTQAAYAYLARDLKKTVTPLYKVSKEYFEKLRKEEPENKTYIKYLININDRLSNSAEVKKLKKLL